MFFAFATILYRSNRILLLKKIGILKERRRESQNRTLTVIICHFLYVALDKHTFEEKCFLKVEIQRIRGNYIFYPINQVILHKLSWFSFHFQSILYCCYLLMHCTVTHFKHHKTPINVLTERSARKRGREKKRMCVCVCVCVRERERE